MLVRFIDVIECNSGQLLLRVVAHVVLPYRKYVYLFILLLMDFCVVSKYQIVMSVLVYAL